MAEPSIGVEHLRLSQLLSTYMDSIREGSDTFLQSPQIVLPPSRD